MSNPLVPCLFIERLPVCRPITGSVLSLTQRTKVLDPMTDETISENIEDPETVTIHLHLYLYVLYFSFTVHNVLRPYHTRTNPLGVVPSQGTCFFNSSQILSCTSFRLPERLYSPKYKSCTLFSIVSFNGKTTGTYMRLFLVPSTYSLLIPLHSSKQPKP